MGDNGDDLAGTISLKHDRKKVIIQKSVGAITHRQLRLCGDKVCVIFFFIITTRSAKPSAFPRSKLLFLQQGSQSQLCGVCCVYALGGGYGALQVRRKNVREAGLRRCKVLRETLDLENPMAGQGRVC
jgi:hypothetical protein